MAALHTWLRNTRLRLTSNQLGGLQGAKDFRVDADLHAACQADADLVCKDVEPGEGRVQDCLVSLRAAEFAACLRWQGSSAQQCSMLVHIAAEKKIVSGQASGRLRPLVPAACWACLIFTAFGNSTHLAELLRAARYLMYAIATAAVWLSLLWRDNATLCPCSVPSMGRCPGSARRSCFDRRWRTPMIFACPSASSAPAWPTRRPSAAMSSQVVRLLLAQTGLQSGHAVLGLGGPPDFPLLGH